MKSVGKEYKAQMPLLTKPDFKPTKKLFFAFRIQKIQIVLFLLEMFAYWERLNRDSKPILIGGVPGEV